MPEENKTKELTPEAQEERIKALEAQFDEYCKNEAHLKSENCRLQEELDAALLIIKVLNRERGER